MLVDDCRKVTFLLTFEGISPGGHYFKRIVNCEGRGEALLQGVVTLGARSSRTYCNGGYRIDILGEIDGGKQREKIHSDFRVFGGKFDGVLDSCRTKNSVVLAAMFTNDTFS